MLKTARIRSYRALSRAPFSINPTTTTTLRATATRSLSTTQPRRRKDDTMASGPPKHEMQYFPELTSKMRSFGEFRKVIHTGLYSQLVAMEVPVGGDIGDEVCSPLLSPPLNARGHMRIDLDWYV